jgi:hypothetical protein
LAVVLGAGYRNGRARHIRNWAGLHRHTYRDSELAVWLPDVRERRMVPLLVVLENRALRADIE